MNIYELLSVPASIFPEAEHLVADGERRSYAEALGAADRLSVLLAEAGIGPGGVVAMLDVNTPTYAAALFATARVGATFVPLNYRARRDELRHMLRTAAVDLVLVGERYAELAASATAELDRAVQLLPLARTAAVALPTLADRLAQTAEPPEPPEPPEVDDDALAVLMFTSGTTAMPKAVELTHAQLSGYVLATTELPEEPIGTTLLAVPLYHIAGLTALLASSFGGRRLALLPQFDAADWLTLVQRERATHAFLVPTMLKRVLEHPSFAAADLGSLEVLSYGSAPMPLPVIRRAIDAFPTSVSFVNAFGQTETTSTVTMLLPDDHRLTGDPGEVERKIRRLSSVGRPLPDVDIAILDDAGQSLPADAIGEVAVRTGRSMRGYRAADGAVAGEWAGDWLRTRDLGYVDDDGYLFLTGRKGDMIIRGGENIAPDEVAAALTAHPAVDEAVVLGLPDEEWGERVAAVVVLRAGATASEAELIEHCRGVLASFKRPDRVVCVAELPRNSMGKVVKRELLPLFAEPSPVGSIPD